ncbi:MAG: DNA polymerase III subunit delta [Verrucomicrobiae bacterium]|nr:DNA polymerase III subunit delta [Verrucomicrobiae bacterium]
MAGPRKKTASKTSSAGISSAVHSHPYHLIYGDDDYLVSEEGRKVVASLTPQGGSEYNVEIVEGSASNQAEAETVFRRLFESLQCQSFFATEKVVWLRNTNLLGSGVTAESAGVSASLSSLSKLLNAGLPPGFSLVITAQDADARRSLFLTIKALGRVTAFKTDPYKGGDDPAKASHFARENAVRLGKNLDDEAALLLAEMTCGDSRTIVSEVEKLAAYAGDEKNLKEEHVREICCRRPGGIVWDLSDAVTERNLSKTLKMLDNLLSCGESPIGLLFTLTSRFRLLVLLSALADKKLLQPTASYPSFKSLIERLPAWVSQSLPSDRKLNPLAGHPFMIWKASAGLRHYTTRELRQALNTLLECNELMFSSGGLPGNLLKDALIRICSKAA